jgi:hypothetical protein
MSTPVPPSSGVTSLVVAAVLLLIGAVGIVLYAVGAPDQLADGGSLGVLRGGLIIVSAACVGVGAFLTVRAITRRRARSARR